MVIALHGTVVNEWPKGCMYWADPDVIRYAERHDLTKYSFDGCRYGLRSPEGYFVKKPWSIMTNNSVLGRGLQRRCHGDHVHVQCRGDL
eukprot:4077556-Prorocentrum_lima.AAC.1